MQHLGFDYAGRFTADRNYGSSRNAGELCGVELVEAEKVVASK